MAPQNERWWYTVFGPRFFMAAAWIGIGVYALCLQVWIVVLCIPVGIVQMIGAWEHDHSAK